MAQTATYGDPIILTATVHTGAPVVGVPEYHSTSNTITLTNAVGEVVGVWTDIQWAADTDHGLPRGLAWAARIKEVGDEFYGSDPLAAQTFDDTYVLGLHHSAEVSVEVNFAPIAELGSLTVTGLESAGTTGTATPDVLQWLSSGSVHYPPSPGWVTSPPTHLVPNYDEMLTLMTQLQADAKTATLEANPRLTLNSS